MEHALYDERLKTMMLVADGGSFSKAAEQLFCSVNTVRNQISSLEAEYGFEIFLRRPQGVSLTAAGQSLYLSAQKIMRFSASALSQATMAASGARATIRIGTSTMFPGAILAGLFRQAALMTPNIVIEMVPFSAENQGLSRELFRLGKDIDLICTSFPVNGLPGVCNTVKINELPVFYLMSLSHPLAKNDAISFDDLTGQHLLVPRLCGHDMDPSGCNVLEKLKNVHLEYCDSMDSRYMNRCETEGVIALSVQGAERAHPMLTTVAPERTDWGNMIPFGICYPLEPSPAVARFMDTIAMLKDVFA